MKASRHERGMDAAADECGKGVRGKGVKSPATCESKKKMTVIDRKSIDIDI